LPSGASQPVGREVSNECADAAYLQRGKAAARLRSAGSLRSSLSVVSPLDPASRASRISRIRAFARARACGRHRVESHALASTRSVSVRISTPTIGRDARGSRQYYVGSVGAWALRPALSVHGTDSSGSAKGTEVIGRMARQIRRPSGVHRVESPFFLLGESPCPIRGDRDRHVEVERGRCWWPVLAGRSPGGCRDLSRPLLDSRRAMPKRGAEKGRWTPTLC